MGLCCSTSSNFTSSSKSEVDDEEFFLSALNETFLSTFKCESFHLEALKKSHSESCLAFENSKDESESKDGVEFHDLVTLRQYINYLLFDGGCDFVKVYGEQKKSECDEYDLVDHIIRGHPVHCADQFTQTTFKNCCQVNQEKTKRCNTRTNNVEDVCNKIFCADVQNENFLHENAFTTDRIIFIQYDQKESSLNDVHLTYRNKLKGENDNNYQIENEESIIPSNKSKKLYVDTKSNDLYPENGEDNLKYRFSSSTGQLEKEYKDKCENIKWQNHGTIDSIVNEYKSILNNNKNQLNCSDKSIQTDMMNQELENEYEENSSTGNNYDNDMDFNDTDCKNNHETVRENNVEEPHDNRPIFWTNQIIAVDRNGICFGIPGLVEANLGKENGISLFGQKIL